MSSIRKLAMTRKIAIWIAISDNDSDNLHLFKEQLASYESQVTSRNLPSTVEVLLPGLYRISNSNMALRGACNDLLGIYQISELRILKTFLQMPEYELREASFSICSSTFEYRSRSVCYLSILKNRKT